MRLNPLIKIYAAILTVACCLFISGKTNQPFVALALVPISAYLLSCIYIVRNNLGFADLVFQAETKGSTATPLPRATHADERLICARRVRNKAPIPDVHNPVHSIACCVGVLSPEGVFNIHPEPVRYFYASDTWTNHQGDAVTATHWMDNEQLGRGPYN